MRATIDYVGEYPVTPQAVQSSVANQALATGADRRQREARSARAARARRQDVERLRVVVVERSRLPHPERHARDGVRGRRSARADHVRAADHSPHAGRILMSITWTDVVDPHELEGIARRVSSAPPVGSPAAALFTGGWPWSSAVAPEPEPDPDAPPEDRRVRTPTVLQMEAVECGAAALASVLGHFGRWVPLEELRQACGVSRDGSKASNLLKAARSYGLDAKGYKYDSIDKLRTLAFPAILFWNFNHFVVLEGFALDRVFLNDPAQGPRVVSLEELDGSYSGVVLAFTPGPSFKPGGAPPDLAAALRRRLIGSEEALLFVVLCGLFLVVPGLLVPTFSRIFIDDYLIGGQQWLVRPLLVVMVATMVVQGILSWLQQRYLLRLETKLALATSSPLLPAHPAAARGLFRQRFAGEIGSRVADQRQGREGDLRQARDHRHRQLMTVFYVVADALLRRRRHAARRADRAVERRRASCSCRACAST